MSEKKEISLEMMLACYQGIHFYNRLTEYMHGIFQTAHSRHYINKFISRIIL